MREIHRGRVEGCLFDQWIVCGEWTPEEIVALDTFLMIFLKEKTPVFGHYKGGWEFSKHPHGLYTARKEWWSSTMIIGLRFENMMSGLKEYFGVREEVAKDG